MILMLYLVHSPCLYFQHYYYQVRCPSVMLPYRSTVLHTLSYHATLYLRLSLTCLYALNDGNLFRHLCHGNSGHFRDMEEGSLLPHSLRSWASISIAIEI